MDKQEKKLHEKIGFRIAIVLFMMISVSVIIVTCYFFHGEIVSKLPTPIPENWEVSTYKVHGRTVFKLQTKEETQRTNQVILYLHGGSYMAELQKEHWLFFQEIMEDTGATFIVPDYPLTPQYTYQEVFQMIEPIYKQLVKQVDEHNLVVMGDSAGGGMALALVQKMSLEKIRMPNQLILLSPWLDTKMENEKIDEVQKVDPVLNKMTLILAGEQYANGKKEEEAYLVSPIHGPLENLCPVIVFTGTYDILNPDVQVLKEKMEKVGGNIAIKQTEKAVHNWILYKYTRKNVYHAQEDYKELVKILQKKAE